MTVDDVVKRVANLTAAHGDDEAAHVEEDSIHLDVLRAIADGTAIDPAGCATAALKTSYIDFCRWCA